MEFLALPKAKLRPGQFFRIDIIYLDVENAKYFSTKLSRGSVEVICENQSEVHIAHSSKNIAMRKILFFTI